MSLDVAPPIATAISDDTVKCARCQALLQDLTYYCATCNLCRYCQITNPLTNRHAIVGGATWKKLVRQKIIGPCQHPEVSAKAQAPTHIVVPTLNFNLHVRIRH